MSELLKKHSFGLPAEQKIWRIMSGSYMHMQSKQKMQKIMMRNVATSRQSKTYNRQWKSRLISVGECL